MSVIRNDGNRWLTTIITLAKVVSVVLILGLGYIVIHFIAKY